MPLFFAGSYGRLLAVGQLLRVTDVAEMKGTGVPLSEEEQRILQEIEARLYEESPELARNVRTTTLYSHAARNIKLAAAGFVIGVAVLIAGLSRHYVISFGGFLTMLGAALYIEHNVRKLGRSGWQEMTRGFRSRGLGSALSSAGRRTRDRFRKR